MLPLYFCTYIWKCWFLSSVFAPYWAVILCLGPSNPQRHLWYLNVGHVSFRGAAKIWCAFYCCCLAESQSSGFNWNHRLSWKQTVEDAEEMKNYLQINSTISKKITLSALGQWLMMGNYSNKLSKLSYLLAIYWCDYWISDDGALFWAIKELVGNKFFLALVSQFQIALHNMMLDIDTTILLSSTELTLSMNFDLEGCARN